MVTLFVLAFAWSAVGTATATLLCARVHREQGGLCRAGFVETVLFAAVAVVWPLVWVGCGVEGLVGWWRGRCGVGGRSAVALGLVRVDRVVDGNGVSEGVVREGVVR